MLPAARAERSNSALSFVPGRVTIVTAVFNAVATLERCIDCVLQQDYTNIEHVLVDGGSTDGSIDILKKYGDRIVWRSEPDRGIYDAWNKGICLATGEWIAFLGADDLYLPGAITVYMNEVRGLDVEYVSSCVRWVSSEDDVRILGDSWKWPDFQHHMTAAHVGSMHHRSFFDRYGEYDLSYRIVGDYEMLLRPGGSLRAHFVPVVTAEMSAGGVSDSFRALREAMRAKVVTGKRSRTAARIEFYVAYGKHAIRKFVRRLAGGTAS